MNPEIFKSESYQKILKYVIKFRYPELSYEEGLATQLLEPSCLLIKKEENGGGNCIYRQCQVVQRLSFINTTHNGCKRLGWDERRYYEYIDRNYQIFGRAITICELCDILNEVYDTSLETDDFFIRGETIERCEYCLEDFDPIYIKPKTYYVHEQLQEVIDKIANLFE